MHRLGAIDAGAVTPARHRAAWTPCRVRADPAAAARTAVETMAKAYAG